MGTVYDDSDPLPDVTYDLVPTGEHEAALAEVQRLREALRHIADHSGDSDALAAHAADALDEDRAHG
jgi:hypothetical protein